MSATVIYMEEDYIEVQPTKAPEVIGCGVKTFYQHAQIGNWERREDGRDTYYKVPMSFVNKFTPKPKNEENVLLDFMKQTKEEMKLLYGEIVETKAENAGYKLLTDQAKSEREQLLQRIWELEAEVKRLNERKTFGQIILNPFKR